jgi:hypothetical protein
MRNPHDRARWWVIAWRWATGNWWRPVPQSFPYPQGWAVFNYGTHTVLDTNLDRNAAVIICRELNSRP